MRERWEHAPWVALWYGPSSNSIHLYRILVGGRKKYTRTGTRTKTMSHSRGTLRFQEEKNEKESICRSLHFVLLLHEQRLFSTLMGYRRHGTGTDQGGKPSTSPYFHKWIGDPPLIAYGSRGKVPALYPSWQIKAKGVICAPSRSAFSK